MDVQGVGFVFSETDPYVGVDMDDCVSTHGAIHPVAHELVETLAGYVEFSPSGRGLHVIVEGSLPRGRHTLKTPWKGELAVYDRGRFFTMLGGRGKIRDAQAELDAIMSRFFPKAPRVDAPVARSQPLCDQDSAVVGRLLADPRMAALWRGDLSDHGGDHSAADLALCSHLAFFTGGDRARMDGLFRQSGLMRSKWDEKRGESTYGWITIDRAIGG